MAALSKQEIHQTEAISAPGTLDFLFPPEAI
jgi:hypothetical protein